MPALRPERRLAKIRRHPVRLLGAVAMALALGACSSANRVAYDPPEPTYQTVHPIVLTHGSRSIDIFLAGGTGRIGERQTADLRAFAAEYRRSGEGPLIIGLPTTDPSARKAVQGIRAALAQAG